MIIWQLRKVREIVAWCDNKNQNRKENGFQISDTSPSTVYQIGPKSKEHSKGMCIWSTWANPDQYKASVNVVHLIKALEMRYIIFTVERRIQNIASALNPSSGNEPELWCTFYDLNWIA